MFRQLSALCTARDKLFGAHLWGKVYLGNMMKTRIKPWIIMLAATWMATASPALADRIPLTELSRYFNAFTTAQGGFTQINPDGTLSTGRIYIHRPGRVRFEYDPPERSLVMAGGSSVAVFDPRSNEGPAQYPLSRTPLNLILTDRVDFSRDRMVVQHTNDDVTTSIVAQDPDNPQYGNIRLNFSANPTELRQWVISDDMGRETTVILNDLQFGQSLRAGLFNITAETESRRR